MSRQESSFIHTFLVEVNEGFVMTHWRDLFTFVVTGFISDSSSFDFAAFH